MNFLQRVHRYFTKLLTYCTCIISLTCTTDANISPTTSQSLNKHWQMQHQIIIRLFWFMHWFCFHGEKKDSYFACRILSFVATENQVLLCIWFASKRSSCFSCFFIVIVRLKKHPSFRRKAFLPTRRRATLVSVFVLVLKGNGFSWILFTYDNSGEPFQNNYALFLLGSICYNLMISCCLVLPLWYECVNPPTIMVWLTLYYFLVSWVFLSLRYSRIPLTLGSTGCVYCRFHKQSKTIITLHQSDCFQNTSRRCRNLYHYIQCLSVHQLLKNRKR